MKLIFRKDESQEITVLIRDQIAEEPFSYIAMIKALIAKNEFELSEFEEGITEQEKESINKMLLQINASIQEPDQTNEL